jgi:replicative DNA helicase
MTREQLIDELSEIFQDEPDNYKFNYVLECADAYAEEYMEQKKERERLQWGKDICENADESTEGLPDKVFLRIADKVEDRMMSNSSEMEQEVVNEVIREYYSGTESEAEK